MAVDAPVPVFVHPGGVGPFRVGCHDRTDGNRVSRVHDGGRSEKKFEFGMKSDERFICTL